MDIFQAPTGGLSAEAGSPEEIARFVVGAAVHAPSVHNTQPWRLSHGEQEISVHADSERRLRVADPHGREMMISCGAALFNIRVALRYLGFVPRVRVLPDPDLPSLVARGGLGSRRPRSSTNSGCSRRSRGGAPTAADSTLPRCHQSCSSPCARRPGGKRRC
ncbi:MAG TPA: hypothetical protein VGA04_07980 [Streptosporangiaceae bacterium]